MNALKDIITIYERQAPDGFGILGIRDVGTQMFFRARHEADTPQAKAAAHSAVPTTDGRFLILSSNEPVCLYNSPADIDRRRQNVLAKLTREERELLGV